MPFKTLFVAALIVAAWLFVNRDKLMGFWEAYQVKNAQQSLVAKLEFERNQMEKQRKLLEHTSLETERLVREQYKMKKPGEKIIILK